MTIDGGKIHVTGHTRDFVHIKTQYYRVDWCNLPNCEEAQHQHTWYDADQPRNETPALTKLVYCRDPTCEHHQDGWHHVHQGNDKVRQTLTVDDQDEVETIDPAIQMSDKASRPLI